MASAIVLTIDAETLRIMIYAHRISLVTLEEKIILCKDRKQAAPLTEVYLETEAALQILENLK